MLSRVIAARSDERGGAGGNSKRSAADGITDLCDVFTHTGLEGSWEDLLRVYDQRRNDDSLREILAMSAPSARMNDLNGWHLERMAVDEYGAGRGRKGDSGADDAAAVRREVRRMRQVVNTVLANGRGFQARRDALVAAMARQREALTAELDAAKDFLGQIHLAGVTTDPTAVGLSAPAPVEQRLLATVKAPEEVASVDLSAAPSI
ncbi:hypothetical protein PybrP1_011726 [[Pythium] brassicae (nom. inval.)]|nr:hypothetical protein PybrP1_011726 [[Pythium] brassicae (nom. inval.)]